jgi:tetraacyldisaccharide 4'-kinase
LAAQAEARGLPVFAGALAPDERAADDLRGRQVFAFAGIGRPEKFFDALREIGAEVVGRRPFPDHYPFRPPDLAALERARRLTGAELLVTTEKDMVRLLRLGPLDAIRTLPVRLRVEREERFSAWLSSALEGRNSPDFQRA